MEIENVSKRQQPDQRTDNSRSPPIGHQCDENLTPAPGGVLQLAPKQKCKISDNGRHTKLRNIDKKLKLKKMYTRLTKARGS